MGRKKTILPAAEAINREQLLQEAEAVVQAYQVRQQEQRQQWLQPTFRSRWENAVDDLTRDPRLSLGPEATVAKLCASKAQAWNAFGELMRSSELAARVEQFQPDDDEARTVAIDLFRHAARGATAAEFERHLVFIASRCDLWGFTNHVQELAWHIWPGIQVQPSQTTSTESPSIPVPLEPPDSPPSDGGTQPTWVQQALVLILTHPDQSVAWYAKRVGRNRTTLYKYDILKAALKNSRKKDRPQRGYRDDDGNIEVDDRPSWRRRRSDEEA